MKILLAYPPDRCLPTIPYSSLAALKGCLVQAGHEVAIRDLNVEVFHHLVKRERLEGYYRYAEWRVRSLERQATLTPSEANEYRFLAPLVAAPAHRILEAEESARLLRDPERFYHPDQFNHAFDNLETTIRFLYAANPVFDPEGSEFIAKCMSALSMGLGDPIADAFREQILDDVLSEKPALVGITLPFTFQFFEALKFLKLLKEATPHVKVVMGGPTVNDYPDVLFGCGRLFELVDFGVAGEGETAIVKLANALESGTPITAVPNLIYRDGGKMRRTETPPDVPDLNALPTPDFTGIPFDRYLTPAPVANLQTSRGCYYGKCTFCGDGFRRNFRMRRPELVFADVAKIHREAGVKFFLFWDSLAPPRTLKAVAEGIIREELDIHWFAETKFEKPYANPELIDLLHRGGCRFLQFGFESASQRVLDLMDKGNDLPRVDKILENMKQTGLMAGCSWFIGFPTETPDEAYETFDFVASRQDRIFMSVYAGTFMLGRDTLVYANPDRYGIHLIRRPDGSADYCMQDGTDHYDRTEMDYSFRARGDLPILNHGAYLAYATHAPDRMRRITGLGRFGVIPRCVEDVISLEPSVADPVTISNFAYDFTAPSDGPLPRRTIAVAYSAKTGLHMRLSSSQEKITRVANGERTAEEIARLTGLSQQQILEDVRLLLSRGILSVPPGAIPAPPLRLLAPVS
ncbi:MAG: radical SAM protein [Planctomycetota bacterium]